MHPQKLPFSSHRPKGQSLFEYAILLSFLVFIGITISSVLENALEYAFVSAIINRGNPEGVPSSLGGEFGTPFSGIDPLNQPPVVAINTDPDPPIVLSGDFITFTSVSYDPDDGDSIQKVEWDIYGDGSVIKTGNQITHTFTTDQPNAIWQPRVTVTDNHGVQVSQLFSVGAYTTEIPNLPPVVQIDVDPTSGPAPLTVTFSSTSFDPDGTVAYHQWNFGETALTKNGTTEQYVYTTPGEYEAELLITDDGGRQARSYRIFITVEEPEAPNEPPSLSVRASNATGTTGSQIDFITDSFSDPDGSVEYYEWDFGDGSPKVGPNIVGGGIPIVPHTYMTAGDYVATMTITDNDGESTSQSVNVTIIESSCSDPTIRRQIWNGITGSALSDLTGSAKYPYYPDGTESLTSLSTSANTGDNYGDRFVGYIIPPTTGAYVFYIASDDQSQFYLSVDESPGGKRLLASVTSWTSYQQWTKQSNQKSAFVSLTAGQKYYFEVVHKEGGGGDHVSVGWIMPGDSYPPNVISQDHLCFDDSLIPSSPPPTPTPTPEPVPTATPPPIVANLALNKPALQSSTGWSGAASRAVDGNTNGTYGSGSVTHTSFNNQPWWEVDLGDVYNIDEIVLWNRTDCCQSRLRAVHIFVSDTPFGSTSLTATQAQAGVGDFYNSGSVGQSATTSINRTGRYVRVQLENSDYLSLAEVQVFGSAVTETLPPVVNGCNFQAEDATLSGPSVKSSHSGYEGTGFADYPGGSGSNVYIEWDVTVGAAGVYHTDFRYALGSGNRPLEFKVNGGVVSSALPFTGTGGWGSWGTQQQLVYLNAGSNTIRLTALNNAGPNVDCLAVYD